MEPELLLRCSQERATDSCYKLKEIIPHCHNLFLSKVHFIRPLVRAPVRWVLGAIFLGV
jgi:hypothetical protein